MPARPYEAHADALPMRSGTTGTGAVPEYLAAGVVARSRERRSRGIEEDSGRRERRSREEIGKIGEIGSGRGHPGHCGFTKV
ncbi:MAG: hypothetical protein R2832_14975 [Rhodothermales bacterium]